jgi:hypothetical protein
MKSLTATIKRLTTKEKLIQALAEYLCGPKTAERSIRLEMKQWEAEEWSKIRSLVPGISGYASVEDAKRCLNLLLD